MGFRVGFGPRLFRLSFGSRGTRLSTGVGPFSLTTSGRRRPGVYYFHAGCEVHHRTPGAASRCTGRR